MNASEQARADALADAETLLQYASGGLRAALKAAPLLPEWDAYGCYVMACTSARAAFRAVPGLRGEDPEPLKPLLDASGRPLSGRIGG